LLFWGLLGSVLVSVVFSIDPFYSFGRLQDQPLKAIIIFCLFSTVLSSETRLRKFVSVTVPVLLFTLAVGYYSYFAYDLPLMKPVTEIRHAWHARFAMDINTLLPFTFVILLMTKNIKLKIALGITILTSISAIILSTSRGGLAAFLCILFAWIIYLVRKRAINTRALLAGGAVIIVLSLIVIGASPNSRSRLARISHDIGDLHLRTEIWARLVASASQRPITGWGYGSDIFEMDEPFENTPFKEAPVHIKDAFRNPHNSFLKIVFHQGSLGLVLYGALLITATVSFWRGAFSTDGLRSLILFACASIMIGTFFVNSVVENPHLADLTLILGIGMAARHATPES